MTSYGVVLPTGKAQWGPDGRARDLIAFAARAEELGFDSVWAGDTLIRPIVETFTMLAAAAAVTERVTLGSAALLPALRRPVQTAQAIASLSLISDGRLTLTVGAGFPGRSGAGVRGLGGTVGGSLRAPGRDRRALAGTVVGRTLVPRPLLRSCRRARNNKP